MAVSEERMESVLEAYINGYANSDPEALASRPVRRGHALGGPGRSQWAEIGLAGS